MQTLALAVAIPAHARVNSQCYPIWNDNRSDMLLVWRGEPHAHPFHAFSTQPDSGNDGCAASGCVHRLFCTDSGVAGWYHSGLDSGGAYVGSNQLTAAWLANPNTNYSRPLSATEGNAAMVDSSGYGPGTLAVAGNTLYFYVYTGYISSAQGLPRLSSLVFTEWREGASGTELVSERLQAHNVLGYDGAYRWGSWASPLYPSGPGAVTLSVESAYENGEDSDGAWAVDAVVDNWSTTALVHYLTSDCLSVITASREVATFPGYSCRAFMNGSVQCAALATDGRHTWATDEQTLTSLGMSFAPLAPFTLPGALWLHVDPYWNYTALVGFGHTPVLAVSGDALVAVERVANTSCTGGAHLALVTRALSSGEETARSESLGCVPAGVGVPGVHSLEPSYAAMAVKWAGPWADSPLLAAGDLAHGCYHELGAPVECAADQYYDGCGCQACPMGTHSDPGATSLDQCLIQCQRGTHGVPGACVACLAGSACPGGETVVSCRGAQYQPEPEQAECLKCAAGNHIVAGTGGNIDCVPCTRGTYAEEGDSSCTACNSTSYAADADDNSVTERGVKCLSCPAGHSCTNGTLGNACATGYAAAEGAGSCRRCGAREYAADAAGAGAVSGATRCLPCRAGHSCANGTLGARCAAGWFAAEGAGVCEDCGGGAWSEEGSGACTPCADGAYRNGAASCIPCPDDTWRAGHQTTCGPCPVGKVCRGGQISALPLDVLLRENALYIGLAAAGVAGLTALAVGIACCVRRRKRAADELAREMLHLQRQQLWAAKQ